MNLNHFKKLGLIKTINGQPMWHGAMFLFIAANEAYAPVPSSDTGKQKGIRVVNGILDAASKAGYTHTGDLRKRLSKGRIGQTTADMAMEAIDAIGGESELMRVLDAAGFNAAHHFPAHTGRLQ